MDFFNNKYVFWLVLRATEEVWGHQNIFLKFLSKSLHFEGRGQHQFGKSLNFDFFWHPSQIQLLKIAISVNIVVWLLIIILKSKTFICYRSPRATCIADNAEE